MTTQKLSEELKAAITKGIDGTPMVDGFLLFDEIRFEKTNDWDGGLWMMFYWHGKFTAKTRVPMPDFANGGTLTINGLEGRQRYTIS